MIALLALSALADPLRPGDVMPDRHWDVVSLDLAVTIDPVAGTVEGTATHTVRPVGQRNGHLRLDQVALDIHQVRIDGAVVEGWHVGPDRLDIPMPERGEQHVVAVDYAATPENGLHFRGPPQDAYVEAWSQGQEQENRWWFPTWDYPNDTFSYTAAITAPADLVVVSNGERVEKTEHDGLATWKYRLDGPIAAYLVAVAIGPYQVFTAEGPVPLEYIAGPGMTEAQARAALGPTPDGMTWLAKTLDEPYPWPVLRQVFIQRFMYGGMENTSLITIADAFAEDTSGPWGQFMEEVIGHELAHQWFGDRVTPYGWSDLWLSEAFASYYAARWRGDLHGDALYATYVYRWQKGAAWDDPRPLAPEAIPRDSLLDVVFMIYARGALALHSLRTWLGPEVFDRAVAAYLDEHVGGLVETADFRRALEDASGMHLGWWFDAYVTGGTFPSATTRWHWEDGNLTVEIEQTTEGVALEQPLRVEIGTSSTTRDVDAWLGAGTTRVVVQMPEPPVWVAVDPEGAAMARLTQEQEPAAWVAQLKTSAHPYARLVAMDHLEQGEGKRDAILALDEVLDADDLPVETREHAAQTLGKIAAPDAVAELLAGLDDEAPYMRAACAEALADVPHKDDVATRLIEAWGHDPDERVRSTVLRVLADQDEDAAVKLARKRLGQPIGPLGYTTKTAVQVLSDHGEASDLGRVLGLASPGVPFDPQWGALHALPDLVEKAEEGSARDAARAKTSRRLESYLSDRDIRMRSAAIALLARSGDSAAAAALGAFASTTEVPSLASAARDAALAIRQRDTTVAPAEPEAPEPDLQALEERLKALEERLQRLESWRY